MCKYDEHEQKIPWVQTSNDIPMVCMVTRAQRWCPRILYCRESNGDWPMVDGSECTDDFNEQEHHYAPHGTPQVEMR
jgi:hypothetical protein